ncbi:type II toxin-antitoxin system PemK/MazF family toxin [Chengkuizengella sp. 2205SS18-9]|uniref:Type II toxin-antitoxin system PemK/MazF family toxin n=1 Tax=Chengkuizengella axinellae TaxID=3064388 RepID=A0ABT9J4U0_9BACL|nr:type II toxin-antitoxin system PemK/MazF family toxin [Chengkuizengella sp. 2205SS18-9]MDP5276609.1 type II toxin-antitoxin system PemK/MazF family toxin [Chengkuizengella sp. 2205SS18-9]
MVRMVTGFAVLCPITRKQKGYPFEVVLPKHLAIEGVILTDQVKSLDWKARAFQIEGKAPGEVVESCLDLIHPFL